MYKAVDIARYFLATQDLDAGERISNMKLQKLCYYAQGFHLALHGKKLFKEPIQAWAHGPVVPELYHRYKVFGFSGIDVPEDVDFEMYDPEVRELLDEVASVYGQFSAWKLRNMTHAEPPWLEAKENWEQEIPPASMKRYFLTQVE